MSVVKTTKNGKNVRIKKPSHIYAQIVNPDGKPLSDDIYEFDEVLRDTTSLSQDDNDTSDIENEVSDTPIDQFLTLGKYQFAATVEDIQRALLIAFCGFSELNGIAFAPSQYEDLWAKVVVVTRDQNKHKVALICPLLKLNSKLILESLNSALGGFSLAGTAYNAEIPAAKFINKNYAAYDATETYAVGDIVTHAATGSSDSKVYVCKTAVATAEAFDVSKWDEIPTYTAATSYSAGAYVLDDGCVYKSGAAVTNAGTEIDLGLWNKVYDAKGVAHDSIMVSPFYIDPDYTLPIGNVL
jgi:hypothetical protein